MKRLSIFLLTLIAAAGLVACGQQTEAPAETASATAPEPAPEPATEAAAEPAGEVVAVNGAMGCGHCNYHVTDSCAPALQAEDGKVYVIETAVEADHEALMEARLKGGGIAVTGTVSEADGVVTIVAESFQLQEKVDSVG